MRQRVRELVGVISAARLETKQTHNEQGDVPCIGAWYAHGKSGTCFNAFLQRGEVAAAVQWWKIRNALAGIECGSSYIFHQSFPSFIEILFQTSRVPPSAGSLTPTTSKSSFLARSFSTAQMGPGSAPASGIMAAPESPYGTLKRGAPGRGSSTRLTPYK